MRVLTYGIVAVVLTHIFVVVVFASSSPNDTFLYEIFNRFSPLCQQKLAKNVISLNKSPCLNGFVRLKQFENDVK